MEKGTNADRPYTVPIGAETKEMLVRLRARAEERAAGAGTKLADVSFVFSDDGGGTTAWNLSWPSHARAATAPRPAVHSLRLHDLRRVAASQMLMGGVPIPVVAERFGCTEANILCTCGHFVPGSDRQAAELMDRLLGGGSGQVAPPPGPRTGTPERLLVVTPGASRRPQGPGPTRSRSHGRRPGSSRASRTAPGSA